MLRDTERTSLLNVMAPHKMSRCVRASLGTLYRVASHVRGVPKQRTLDLECAPLRTQISTPSSPGNVLVALSLDATRKTPKDRRSCTWGPERARNPPGKDPYGKRLKRRHCTSFPTRVLRGCFPQEHRSLQGMSLQTAVSDCGRQEKYPPSSPHGLSLPCGQEHGSEYCSK